MRKDLNFIEERRKITAIEMQAYQRKVAELYNKQIRERSFKVGDLVLRNVTAKTKNPTDGKLGPTWEGPYEVIKVFGKRVYSLKSVAKPDKKITSS